MRKLFNWIIDRFRGDDWMFEGKEMGFIFSTIAGELLKRILGDFDETQIVIPHTLDLNYETAFSVGGKSCRFVTTFFPIDEPKHYGISWEVTENGNPVASGKRPQDELKEAVVEIAQAFGHSAERSRAILAKV